MYIRVAIQTMADQEKLPDSTEKWEKVMADIDSLIEIAKNEADRNYFQRARDLLMKMKQK